MMKIANATEDLHLHCPICTLHCAVSSLCTPCPLRRILMPTRWLKLTLAYDGTNYAGWQIQPDEADAAGDARDGAGRRSPASQIRVTASGRTDAGVHALGQVVSFAHRNATLDRRPAPRASTPSCPTTWPSSRSKLRRDGFHATRDAVRQTLSLRDRRRPRRRDVFARRYAWHYPQPLDGRGHARRRPGAGRHARLRQLRDRRLRTSRQRPHVYSQSDVSCATPTASPSKSPATDSSITWSARSLVRWSKWAAARRDEPGPPKSSPPAIAAPPAKPRRRKDCSWSASTIESLCR